MARHISVTVGRQPNPQAGPLTLAQFQAAMTRRFFLGHQSIGLQVLTGIDEHATAFGQPDPLRVDLSTTSPPASGGFVGDAYVGINGDGYTKTRGDHSVGEPLAEPSFATRVAQWASDIDTAVLKFCYADLRPTSSHYAIGGYTPAMLFTEYKATIDQLVATYPSIAFIYATEPVVYRYDEDDEGPGGTGGNHANDLRFAFNQLVRAEYGATGRLWDIALAQSTDPNGNRIRNANGSDSLFLDYASPDWEHISGLDGIGRKAAAKPLLQVMAGLGG